MASAETKLPHSAGHTPSLFNFAVTILMLVFLERCAHAIHNSKAAREADRILFWGACVRVFCSLLALAELGPSAIGRRSP